MSTYVALVHKDPDSDYGVSFPDLPGCVTAGTSLDEAIANAKEALALHMEGMLEDGEDVPIPTAADAINHEDALLIAAVDVPNDLKVERVNITVPAITLARIDSFARERGMTRSALLVEAAQRWITERHASINSPERPRRIPALAAAREPDAHSEMEFAALRTLAASEEAALAAARSALVASEEVAASRKVPFTKDLPEAKPPPTGWLSEFFGRVREKERGMKPSHESAMQDEPTIEDLMENIRRAVEETAAKKQTG